MNILLIAEKFSSLELPANSEVGSHILQVFNAKLGDTIDIGVRNGPRGKATIVTLNSHDLKLSIKWNQDHTNDLYPVGLLVGLSRPQTCRKILEQASTLGVSSIDFFISDKSEPSYRDSKLWKTMEWEEKIQKGVEQAFCTFIPRCTVWSSLAECIESQPVDSSRIALDNYESTGVLTPSFAKKERTRYLVAVGAERGWSDAERKRLRASDFLLLSLGSRVLRQETAVVVAIGQLVSQFWES